MAQAQPVSVIVCRYGCLPIVEPLVPEHESYLAAARKLIGCGILQIVQIGELEIWSDEDGLATKPLNRIVSYSDDNAEELFEQHAIHGDFLLVRWANTGHEIVPVDVLDSDWTHYLKLYEAEDLEAAWRMNTEACSKANAKAFDVSDADDEDTGEYEGSFCETADNEGARIAAEDRSEDAS